MISFILQVSIQYLLGGRGYRQQGGQNPNLVEFVTCSEFSDSICIPANSFCEWQLRHFHEPVRNTLTKVVGRNERYYQPNVNSVVIASEGVWQIWKYAVLWGSLWPGIDSSRDIMHPRHIIRILVAFLPYSWYLWATIHRSVIKGETANLSSVQMKP